MLFRMIIAILALGVNAKCQDNYLQPVSGGTWCSDLKDPTDQTNCWGSCWSGCSHPIHKTGCAAETRPPKAAICPLPGASSPLCCIHCSSEGEDIAKGSLNNSKKDEESA